jgi:hypothetical protein
MEPNDLSSFRRGKSKVFYASDIWDPGEEARTSFRSNGSDDDDDTFVASLLRRKAPAATSGYVDDYDFEDEIEEEMEYRAYFSPAHVKATAGRPSVLNRSVELDDIMEEDADDREADGDDENEGSPSPAAISSPSSHSPEGSFRLPRGASVRRSQESNESSSSGSGNEASVTPPVRKTVRTTKTVGSAVSHKNNDSGFSDSGGSQNGDDSKKCAIKVRSQVVHETRNVPGLDGKPLHVSKIYFYSVNQDEAGGHDGQAANGHHISILDCETGRVRQGYAHSSPSPLLSPPLSPPPPVPPHCPNTSSESVDVPKLDPLACDIDYYDAFVVNRPHPVVAVMPEPPFASPR